MKRLFIGILLLFISTMGFGQSQIGTKEVFATGNNFGIFTRSTGGWTTASTSPNSSTYSSPVSASASFYARLGNGTVNGTYLTMTSPISTLNKTNITVYFSEWISGSFTTSRVKLEYSINNGSTWTVSSFASSASGSSNNTLKSFVLPSICENVSQLKLRFSVNATYTTSGSYRIDDFAVFGTGVLVNYYNDLSGGLLDDVNSWWTNTDGTGNQPSDFSTELQVFNIVNGGTAGIGGYWPVSGSGSKIVVGDGTNAVNFYSDQAVDGTIDVNSNATLTVATDAYVPSLGTLASGSLVVYDFATDQSIESATYYNLSLLGGNKVFDGSGSYTISNTLDVSGLTGGSFVVLGDQKITFNGSISGIPVFSGNTYTGNAVSELNISKTGGGSLGTISFDPSSSLYRLIISNGNVSLGSDLQLDGVAFSTPTLSIATGASLDAGSYTIKGSSSLTESIAINGTLKTSNLNGLSGGSATTFDTELPSPILSSSTIEYNAGSGTQNITAFASPNSYNHLVLSGNATKAFASSAYGINGDFTRTGGAASINSGASFTFGGSAQNIAALAYPTVVFSGSGSKTLATDDSTRISNSLTVNGTASVVTGGKLVLLSTSNSNAAMILDNTASGGISGNVSVERTITTSRSGTPSASGLPILLSSPVTGNLTLFQSNNTNFYDYVPTNTTGGRYVKVSVGSSAQAGKGYLLRKKGGTKYHFYGSVNTGNITQNLVFGGDNFNLIGNPYPSSIVWNSSNITMTNLASSNQFKVFNGSAYQVKNVGDLIPLGQGFFVEAASSGASVVFTNASRSATQSALYRTQGSSDNRTELWISRGKKEDMAVLWAQPGADSKVYKNVYDGKKFLPTDASYPAVYFPKEDKSLDVFTFGTTESNVSVPVAIKLPADTIYTLEFKGKENLDPAISVYLIDSILNVVQDLKTNSTYSFSGTTSTGNRFRILSSQVITDTRDVSLDKGQFTVYADGQFAHITAHGVPNLVEIRNLTGSTVYRANGNNSNSITVDMRNNPEGIYIVSVEMDGVLSNKKFILNK